MGLIKIVFSIMGVLILAVVGIGAYLYFTDYEAEGTITEKGSDYVVIRPKLIPRDLTQSIDSQTAQFVCKGYEVTYRIQSQHYRVFDAKGTLVYDSVEGLKDPARLTRCAVLGS